jgi:hypothetical protein
MITVFLASDDRLVFPDATEADPQGSHYDGYAFTVLEDTEPIAWLNGGQAIGWTVDEDLASPDD